MFVKCHLNNKKIFCTSVSSFIYFFIKKSGLEPWTYYNLKYLHNLKYLTKRIIQQELQFYEIF